MKKMTVCYCISVWFYSIWEKKDILIKVPKVSVCGASMTSLGDETIKYSWWILMIHHIYCLVRVIHVATPIRHRRKCKIEPLVIINISSHINPQRMLSVFTSVWVIVARCCCITVLSLSWFQRPKLSENTRQFWKPVMNVYSQNIKSQSHSALVNGYIS